MNNTHKPFYYLDKCIHVLVVDDQREIITFIEELIRHMGLYLLHTASNGQEALKLLQSPQRIHLCIFDLGISDCQGDEFFLIKQFGAALPFIVFTAKTSPRAGFLARHYGAFDIIEKSNNLEAATFLKTINTAALQSIINPKYAISSPKDSLRQATDILFKHSPRFVADWAQLLSMTDRALRYIWTKNLGANAKIILAIYQIFMAAFGYYDRLLTENSSRTGTTDTSSSQYRRLEEFFHMHKSTIHDFINYGNIVVACDGLTQE
ncbi:MAG: response regulator [Chitinivibrionales bacterium]|nr:response regulator [Chitinivibrionales bacterium]